MNRLRFSVEIDAPRKKEWETMLGDATYREWTAEFMPGSHYVGHWSEGSRILFLAPGEKGESGMASRIRTNRPYEFLSIEHVGIVDVPGGDSSQVLGQVAVSPDGRTLVATAQITGKLLVVDIGEPMKPKFARSVTKGDWPWLVSFTPDGREVWVPNQLSNDVTVIDAQRWSVVTTVKGEFAQPDGIGISGDGRLVFVANHNTSHVMTMGGIKMAMPASATTAAPGRVIAVVLPLFYSP